MMRDITYLPTRREAKAVRSRALHAQRLAEASTPEAQLLAAMARVRAVIKAGDDIDDVMLTSDEAVAALNAVADRAEERAITKARRRQRVRAVA
jgi:hypothetical protein